VQQLTEARLTCSTETRSGELIVTASSLPVTSLQSPRYVPITETPRETKTKTLIDVLLQELQQTLLCISDALPLPLQHVCALAALEAWRLRDAARATSTTTNTNTALAANCIRLQCAAVRNRLAALHCTALHERLQNTLPVSAWRPAAPRRSMAHISGTAGVPASVDALPECSPRRRALRFWYKTPYPSSP
jgi:hypothetical protein